MLIVHKQLHTAATAHKSSSGGIYYRDLLSEASEVSDDE